MSAPGLIASGGPHVFVDSLTVPVLGDDDRSHLERSLRMRSGDPLTLSNGHGSWAPARLGGAGTLEVTGAVEFVEPADVEVTVAFSLVKGSKPEVVVQKLTELAVDHIVVLSADRTVVRWDEAKVAKAMVRWERVVREAAMQSRRVRLPTVEALVESRAFLARADVAIAHFDGEPVTAAHRCVAVGPEGGWSDEELAIGASRVTLGRTVLRAETAAISAGTLLSAARG